MPGDLITPLDSNPPDSSLNLVPPTIRNLQIIDNNSLHLQDIIKADGGLMGAYNNMKIYITAYEMKKIFPNAPVGRREAVREQLNEDMSDYEIITNNRFAQFIGQVGEETGGLTSLSEYFYYSTTAALEGAFKSLFLPTKNGPALYNAADYIKNAPKLMGIVPYVPFYARGLIGLTGEGTYNLFSNFYSSMYHVNADFYSTDADRDLLATNIPVATRSGLWYFQKYVIDIPNFDIDTASVFEITKKVNAGSPDASHEDVREGYYNRALRVLKAASLNPFPRFNQPYSSYPFELFSPHPHFPLPLHPTQVFSPIGTHFEHPLKMHLNYRNQSYQSPSMFEQISGHTLMSSYAPYHGAIHQNPIHQNNASKSPSSYAFAFITSGSSNSTSRF